jgi:4'-phosphopantetheinyl transferase
MLVSNTGVAGGADPTNWVIPESHPPLEQHEVHVWKIGLLASQVQLGQLRKLLSDDELERADRFRFERHRRRFITGRAVVRILLGKYANRPPEALDFSYNSHGKPSLKESGSLEFNFTNSRDLSLLCIARQAQLGIDLEHLGRHADYAGIANRFFAEREVEELFSLPESRRHAAFLTGWTRKEAYIKALGTGLSLPLDKFAVTIDPEAAPALISADDRPDEPDRWVFQHLEPEPGYVASLVVEGGGWEIRNYCWEE